MGDWELGLGTAELCAWLGRSSSSNVGMREVAFAAARDILLLYLCYESTVFINDMRIGVLRMASTTTAELGEKTSCDAIFVDFGMIYGWIGTSCSRADFSPAGVEQSCRLGASWIGGRILAATSPTSPITPNLNNRACILEWAILAKGLP